MDKELLKDNITFIDFIASLNLLDQDTKTQNFSWGNS